MPHKVDSDYLCSLLNLLSHVSLLLEFSASPLSEWMKLFNANQPTTSTHKSLELNSLC